MNQAAWDAMILNLARRDVDVRTGEFWKRRRDTADLMARISRALGVDSMEKEKAPAPAGTGDERKEK